MWWQHVTKHFAATSNDVNLNRYKTYFISTLCQRTFTRKIYGDELRADEAQWMQSYKNVNYLYIYIGLEFCVMNGDLAIRSAIFEEVLAKN